MRSTATSAGGPGDEEMILGKIVGVLPLRRRRPLDAAALVLLLLALEDRGEPRRDALPHESVSLHPLVLPGDARLGGVLLVGGAVPYVTIRSTPPRRASPGRRSEEHTSELQSRGHLVCRLLLEKKKKRE